jgi:NADPH:quinone reductase-like Zn-dependent oxidoreductase
MTEVATVGTAFITAYPGLVNVAGVREGEWVVVTGANGAVGSSVLQLARWRRARTIGVERGRTDARPRADIAADARIDTAVEYARILRALSEGFDSGALRPPRIAMTVRMADAVDAYVRVAEGSADGKVVFSLA